MKKQRGLFIVTVFATLLPLLIGIVLWSRLPALVKYNNTGYASAMAVIFIIVLVVFTLVFMQSLWNPKKK